MREVRPLACVGVFPGGNGAVLRRIGAYELDLRTHEGPRSGGGFAGDAVRAGQGQVPGGGWQRQL
jgi:hypothetical protein